MRLLEFFLLLTNVLIVLSVCIPSQFSAGKLLSINIGSIIILVTHLLVEGFRWQLIISYLISICFFAYSLYRYFKRNYIRKALRRPYRIISASFLVLAVLLSASLAAFLPVYNLPSPNGSYNVGTHSFCFVDKSRDELFTDDKGDKRTLMVQVWYPTKNIGGVQLAEYIPGGNEALRGILNENGIPEILGDYLKYVKGNSYADAAVFPTDAPYPFIVFNHGMGTSRLLHASQCETLASNGYIVASIDHSYNTAITVFPGGKQIFDANIDLKTVSDRNQVGQVWSQDVSFVIDQFAQINDGSIPSPFQGMIDINKIGVAGHSFGGAAAFDSFYYDDRVKAGIDMDGSLYNIESYSIDMMKNSAKSFLFLMSSQQIDIRVQYEKPSDEILSKMKMTKEEFEEAAKVFLLETDIMKSAAKENGYLISIDNTAHYSFTDLPLFSWLVRFSGMAGSIDGSRGTTIVNKLIVGFFNEKLKGTETGIINNTAQEYPEIHVMNPV